MWYPPLVILSFTSGRYENKPANSIYILARTTLHLSLHDKCGNVVRMRKLQSTSYQCGSTLAPATCTWAIQRGQNDAFWLTDTTLPWIDERWLLLWTSSRFTLSWLELLDLQTNYARPTTLLARVSSRATGGQQAHYFFKCIKSY